MFKRIDHVAIIVRDREKSIKFYEDNFGFRKYFEHDVPVPIIDKIVYLKLADTELELVHMPGGGATNSGYHFCIISDDFQDDYNRLKEKGVKVEQEPHPTNPRVSTEAGWKRAVFTGPDGEAIEIRG